MTTFRRPVFEAIDDEPTREALQWLYEYILQQSLLKANLQLFELTFSRAETTLDVPHNLGLVPRDIIPTYWTDGVTVTFNRDRFTSTTFNITTSAAGTVRFLGGSI